MKKLFTTVIVGTLFYATACKDDAGVSPAAGNTKTAAQDTALVLPQDTVPVSPQPADTTVVLPPTEPGSQPVKEGETYFSPSDLELIAALKNTLPSDVISGFEEKYSAWKSTWTIPGMGGAYIRDFAQSEEYDKLLHYCARYGKAAWPLFIDKLARGDVFTGNLFEDLIYTGKGRLIANLMAPYLPSQIGIPLPSSISLLREYSQKLLAQEETNIRIAIRDISATGYDMGFEAEITVAGQEITINLNSETDANAFVKVCYYHYPGYMIFLYAANHDISKGRQTLGISTANFRVPPDTQVDVSVHIDGKAILKKLTI
jgi:hypothetical protein